MSETHFSWADSENANLKEPIEALRQQGWQYGDVPTASNFNWLFNELQKELEQARANTQELTKIITLLKSDLAKTETKAHRGLEVGHVNSENIKHDLGMFYQLCDLLKTQEDSIRRYHPNFPIHPWPRNSRVRANAEEDGTTRVAEVVLG